MPAPKPLTPEEAERLRRLLEMNDEGADPRGMDNMLPLIPTPYAPPRDMRSPEGDMQAPRKRTSSTLRQGPGMVSRGNPWMPPRSGPTNEDDPRNFFNQFPGPRAVTPAMRAPRTPEDLAELGFRLGYREGALTDFVRRHAGELDNPNTARSLTFPGRAPRPLSME